MNVLPGPLIIPLEVHAEVDGVPISSITVRRPTREDFSAVSRMNARAEVKTMHFLSRLTGLDWRVLVLIGDANDGLLKQMDDWLTPQAPF